MLRVNKGRGPRSRFGVVVAQIRVNFALLTLPRRIYNPEVLYGPSVHDPSNEQFPRAAIYRSVLLKVGVLDIPGSNKATKDRRLIAQRGMRPHRRDRCSHVKAWIGCNCLPCSSCRGSAFA